MLGCAAVAAVTLILYASLATCFLGEERRPQGQVGIEDMVRNRANYVIITVVEGP